MLWLLSQKIRCKWTQPPLAQHCQAGRVCCHRAFGSSAFPDPTVDEVDTFLQEISILMVLNFKKWKKKKEKLSSCFSFVFWKESNPIFLISFKGGCWLLTAHPVSFRAFVYFANPVPFTYTKRTQEPGSTTVGISFLHPALCITSPSASVGLG